MANALPFILEVARDGIRSHIFGGKQKNRGWARRYRHCEGNCEPSFKIQTFVCIKSYIDRPPSITVDPFDIDPQMIS